jgi:hypothetical protein
MVVARWKSVATTRLTPSRPILLICAALIVPVVQLVIGVPMTGHYEAHDGPFAVLNLVQFRSELLAGNPVPRWVVVGNAGLGSPIFFFYPPGAYYLAALLGFAVPALPAATLIGLSQVLFRAAAILTCFVWLRRRATTEAALTGGALYGLMPGVSMINPQLRLDFAECAVTALFPLAFLAIDAGRGQAPKLIVSASAAVFALTLVHVTTTVAAVGIMIVYAASSANTWREALHSAANTTLGAALGLGLAGCYLVPALGLLGTISTSALWDPDHQPEGHFILGLNTFQSLLGRLVDIGLLVPILLVLIVCGGAIAGRRAPRALLASFAIAVFFTIPLSAPLWSALKPLRMVQFPGRFMVLVSLLACASIASVLPTCRLGLRRFTLAAGLGLCVSGVVFAMWYGDGMSTGADRTRQAIKNPSASAPEYIPAEAGARGWLSLRLHGGDLQRYAAPLLSGCVERHSTSAPTNGNRLSFDVGNCVGPTRLPQFYFPGWIADADGHPTPVTPDPTSGLVSTIVSPGTTTVTLHRTWLAIEWIGLAVSCVAFVIWLAVGAVAASEVRNGRRIAVATHGSIAVFHSAASGSLPDLSIVDRRPNTGRALTHAMSDLFDK